MPSFAVSCEEVLNRMFTLRPLVMPPLHYKHAAQGLTPYRKRQRASTMSSRSSAAAWRAVCRRNFALAASSAAALAAPFRSRTCILNRVVLLCLPRS